MSGWTTEKRNAIINLIATFDKYAHDVGDTFLTVQLQSNDISNHAIIMRELNYLQTARRDLTSILNNADAANQKNKLKEIGALQQTIKNSKTTLKKLKDELNVAESREDAIKNRDTQSSYAQTFGYIFRPFRRLSYTIIVPLIFVMLITAGYVVWTAPASIHLNKSMNIPRASAPPMNNSFNKQMKELFK
jgi:hypothetical protein